jgi:acetyl-CoA acyltransferase 1
VSDGAAAVVVAHRNTARELGLEVLGVLRGVAVVGVPPEIMGVGPAVAIPEALKAANLTVHDVDIFEINEAFASQCLYCVRELGIPIEKVSRSPLSGQGAWALRAHAALRVWLCVLR